MAVAIKNIGITAENIDAALRYAETFGWSLFPCDREKKPLTDHGFKDATSDPSVIRELWKKDPGGNVATACGQSGIVVVDLDCKHGVDGIEAWAALSEDHDEIMTAESRTPSGGRHLFFLAPDIAEIRNSAGKIAPGVDVRADGGYIVLPPSQTDAGGYEWIHPPEDGIAPLPAWLCELLAKPDPKPLPPSTSKQDRDLSHYIETAITNEVETVRAAGNGTRNQALNTSAFSLAGLIHCGLTEDRIVSELLRAAIDAGLPEREARQTIQSGIRAGREHPRDIPEGRPGNGKQTKPTTANYRLEFITGADGKNEPVRFAVPLLEITRGLNTVTGGWPKRIGDLLFVEVGGVIRYLGSPESLFAWIGERRTLQWRSGVDSAGITLTPKGEFHESLRATVECFESVEECPHEPQIAGSYYAWRGPEGYTADGRALTGLLEYFDNAETEADRVLIRAMFLTPAWGGLAGLRPAFLIMAPDRNCGKTTLADTVGSLYGGAVSLEPDESHDTRLVSRLLSDSALTKRVVLLDNVKTAQSSAQLEGLITSSTISGHRLYAGEASRPNYLTVLVTGNAVRLSRDLADRAFIIRLRKPKGRPGWNEELRQYLDQHREHVLADIVGALRKPVAPTEARDRWQSWVSHVLARCTDDAGAVVEQNQTRRNDADDDLEEASMIADALRGRGRLFLTNAEACEAVNHALHVTWTTSRVTRRIRGHIEAGRLQGIEHNRTGAVRGWNVNE